MSPERPHGKRGINTNLLSEPGLPRTTVEDDRLLLRHLGDGRARPLLADTTTLEAPIRHQVRTPQRSPVDVDVAGVDLPDRPDRTRDVRSENAGGQAECGAVRLGDGRLPVLGGADCHGRAEELVLTER